MAVSAQGQAQPQVSTVQLYVVWYKPYLFSRPSPSATLGASWGSLCLKALSRRHRRPQVRFVRRQTRKLLPQRRLTFPTRALVALRCQRRCPAELKMAAPVAPTQPTVGGLTTPQPMPGVRPLQLSCLAQPGPVESRVCVVCSCVSKHPWCSPGTPKSPHSLAEAQDRQESSP